MTNLFRIATITVALSLPASARADDAGTAVEQASAQPANEAACPLSPDVLAGIAELRAYGDRFVPVIDLIIAEATKPGWTWGADCEASLQLAASR